MAGGPGAAVHVEHLRFGYRADEAVLYDVDLHIDRGERVTIVGASGAGKTTLASLVAGLRRPWTGTIHIGGADLATVDPTERSRLVAMVAQEGHVFARSVLDNVTVARSDATADDARAAVAAVGADRWVDDLPDGIHTIVGPAHHVLSPPQAQQLGLARLVCADPAIVILDDAVRRLDACHARTVAADPTRALARG